MKAERFKQIDELFEAALEMEPAERAAFLGQACASDEESRRKVEALLAADQKARDFIEAPALEIAARGLAEEQARSSNQTCLVAGRRIDHYEIVSILGAGGMGEVYLAEDTRLGRKTALKLLPAQFTQDAERVQRFKREARAASALNHPNIITIYDIGEWEGEHFIAAEYIEGQTLRERMSGRTLKVEDALNVTLQVASALQAAHAAGIVHRDIKPENVMVRPDGLVKVLDFGLARSAAREPASSRSPVPTVVTMQTDDGMLMGTIAYLSPEQVLRQEVDHRTDIFSLGIVLYELVTGSRPFTGDSVAAICEAILRHTPAPIARADVPDALKRVISRALKKDCAARYQTADEMRSDLQHLIREANGVRPGLSSGQRSKAVLGLGALVILTIIQVMGPRRETGSEMPPFSTGPIRRITDTPGQEIFPSLSPDGQTIVYASRATGNWDIYLKKVDETQAVNLTANSPVYDMEPAFSPDGTRIAFYSSREGRGIFLMDRNGQNVTKLSVDGRNPAWSPDGREIALAEDRVFDYEGRNNSNSRLFAVNVQTGARRLITNSDAVQPNWSPNGHRIAYWGVHKGGQRDIWTVLAAGGEPVAVTDDKAVDWNPVWSRDGRHLYFLTDVTQSPIVL